MNGLCGTHPILDCAASAAWEKSLFGGDEAREWEAMQAAGRAVAQAWRESLSTAGFGSGRGRLLVLVGKGHNGGDAMLAGAELLAEPDSHWVVEVGFVMGQHQLRPLALAAWRRLQEVGGAHPDRLRVVRRESIGGPYAGVLDGVFGFQFCAPLAEPVLGWIAAAAAA